MRLIRAIKTGLRDDSGPVQPLVPVGARAEIDPLVIPLTGIRVTAIVMNFARRKQQHIALTADELLALVLNHPFTTHRQVEDKPFHTQRTVDKEIQITTGFNRR